jgi:glutamate N-acetyltransferase/amino-acid N-acetyltransferase
VDLFIESVDGTLKLVENGMATDYSEEFATKILSGKVVKAIADLKLGSATATAWGCDFSYDYVKINADYRS